MGSSVGISSVWNLRYFIFAFFYSQKSKIKITSLLPNRHLPLLSRKGKGVLPTTLMDSIDQTDLWFGQHLSACKICKVFIKCWLDSMPCCIQNPFQWKTRYVRPWHTFIREVLTWMGDTWAAVFTHPSVFLKTLHLFHQIQAFPKEIQNGHCHTLSNVWTGSLTSFFVFFSHK